MPGVVTLKDLIDSVRDHLASWPVSSSLNGSLSDSTETVTLTASAANAFAEQRSILEVENEVMLIVSITGNVATVIRGYQGSTAAAHADLTAVKVHPSWGWTDRTIRFQHIQRAIRWLKPTAWVIGVSETFVWPQGSLDTQVPTSSLIDLPTGNYIHDLEYRDTSGRFIPFDGWSALGPYIRFSKRAGQDRTLHAIIQVFQPQLQDLTSTLNDDDFAEAIELYTAHLALNTLKTNRVRFAEYSASLNDRSSTPDELIRMAFDLKNQAILAREAATKPPLPTRISTYRPPVI